MADPPLNDLVKDLAKRLADLDPQELTRMAAEDIASAFADSRDASKAVCLEGYLGPTVQHDGKPWRVLYVDLEVETWLLVEADGIIEYKRTEHSTWPYKRDLIWVKPGAAVGICRGAQSVQAQFLTGEFTRAEDFEAPPTGGRLAGATGVFCQARSVGCCYGARSR